MTPGLWSGYWKIIRLDSETFQTIKKADDGFWYALKLFIIVGLILGLGKFANAGGLFDQTILPGFIHDIGAALASAAAVLPSFLAEPLQEISQSITELEQTLSQFQPPLGRTPSRLIRLIGDWLSTPLNLMTIWLGFGLILWIVAKAMHGQGTIRDHLTLITLGVAPQVLALMSVIAWEVGGLDVMGPFVRLLTLGAWVWSLVIVVKGLGEAHEFDRRQSVTVFIVYMLTILVLLFMAAAVGGYVLSGTLV